MPNFSDDSIFIPVSWKRVGYKHLSRISVHHPLHLKEIIIPFQILKLILSHNRPLESRTLFQKGEKLVKFHGFEFRKPEHGPYFECNIVCNGLCGWLNNVHYHLIINVMLNVLKSRTPNSPLVLAYILVPRKLSGIFYWFCRDPTKESASYFFSIFSLTHLGSIKKNI